MISHAAATDIPMAHPIIPPNIAADEEKLRKYIMYRKHSSASLCCTIPNKFVGSSSSMLSPAFASTSCRSPTINTNKY